MMLSVPDAAHCFGCPTEATHSFNERVTKRCCCWRRREEEEEEEEVVVKGMGGEVGREGGRKEERVISQTSVVNHFTPSGSVRQGKKKACAAWPSLHRKVHRQAGVAAPLLSSALRG